MKNPTIEYISREQMRALSGRDYFGLCLFGNNLIPPRVYVVADLPAMVRKSVLAHEMQHAKDGDRGGFWKNEPRCWFAGFMAQPVGFFWAIALSLTPSRIAVYIDRLKNKN